ncbi:Serine/threonine-protein kinase par-1 [Gaertneriomyces sp. JEL0708]|nr:Serine/threonine-protein kinase par-1 [Gaertneriomyces sp. JEL0708]
MSSSKSRSGRSSKDDSNPALLLPSIGNYLFQKTVGEGNFAKVKLAKHKLTGVEVAIKIIDKTALDEKKLSKLYREVRIMKLLHHPNIVKLYEVIETKTTVFLVMEYASGGELYDYLVVHGKMKEKEARAKFRQILSAVSYCHKKRVIHRDLKAENLLLDANLDIKIADFGFSNYYDPESKLDTFCGSPPYAAPELFQGRKYTGPEVDIWSLGVILYVLTTGCLPFDGKNLPEMRESVCRGKYRIPFYLSDSCEKLLRKFLVREPTKRAGLEMLIDDPWINEGFSDSPISTDVSQQVSEDDSIIKLMEAKYHIDPAVIIQKLRDNVYDDVSSIYYLLYYEKDAKGNITQEMLASPVSTAAPALPSAHAKEASQKPNMMRIDEDGVLEEQQPAAVAAAAAAAAAASGGAPVPVARPGVTSAARRRRFTVGGEADMVKYAEDGEEATAMLKKLAAPGLAVVKDDNESPAPMNGPLPIRSVAATPTGNSVDIPPRPATSHGVPYESSPGSGAEGPASPQPGGEVGTPRRKRNNTIVGILRGGISRRTSDAPHPDDSKLFNEISIPPSIPSSTASISSTSSNKPADNTPRSLRFTFNSNTTSSKPPDEIIASVLQSCIKCDVQGRLQGRFLVECVTKGVGGEIKFEIEVCKLPRLKNLHGLRFKRVAGTSGEYKDVCEKVLEGVEL